MKIRLIESIDSYGDLTFDNNPSTFITISSTEFGLSYDYDNDPDDDWAYCNDCYNIYKGTDYVGGIALNVQGDSIEIQALHIIPQYRNLGIGKQVVNWLKTKFKNSLLCVQSLPTSIQFWKQNGFNMYPYNENNGTAYGEYET